MNEVFCKPITAELMNQILITHVVPDDSSSSIGNKAGGLGYDLPANEAQLFALEHFPLLDMNKAIGTVGNEHLVRQVLELMISDEIKKDIAVIQSAHAQGDWEEIEKFAHKMKGGAVYIGTVKMQYACQYLERYQKAGFTSLLEPLYQQLITVVNDTQDYIRVWLTKS
jgi:HPt (histidine-containing phosphotransfer) domain-containing protein